MSGTLSVQAQTLHQLETQVDHLLQAYQDLQQAHVALQQRLTRAEDHRQLACQQLDAVLARLVALEEGS